jgi:hypothetical protein
MQLHYDKYTHIEILEIIYNKKTLRKLYCQTVSVFSTDNFHKDNFPTIKTCNRFLKSCGSKNTPSGGLVVTMLTE